MSLGNLVGSLEQEMAEVTAKLRNANGERDQLERRVATLKEQRRLLVSAGRKVMADLQKRIDAASKAEQPVPVFDGIAYLDAALCCAIDAMKAEGDEE